MRERKIHEVKTEVFSLNKRKAHYIQQQTAITKKTIKKKDFKKGKEGMKP